MKKITVTLLALLCWTLGAAASAGAADNWMLMKNSDGIKTYERTVPGKAVRDVFNKYIEKIVMDKRKNERLKNNKQMTEEITDLIMTYCEASDKTIDSIVARYNR